MPWGLFFAALVLVGVVLVAAMSWIWQPPQDELKPSRPAEAQGHREANLNPVKDTA